jgi:hypothetical protein
MVPISKDALDGPALLINLAVVHAWIGEPDQAIETLAPLIRVHWGISYGQLKLDPIGSRSEKIRALTLWQAVSRVSAAGLELLVTFRL